MILPEDNFHQEILGRDIGVQSQGADETACAWRVMGEQANESDTIWVYKCSGPGDGTRSPFISENIGKPSLKWMVRARRPIVSLTAASG
jgi:hypothetical protein